MYYNLEDSSFKKENGKLLMLNPMTGEYLPVNNDAGLFLGGGGWIRPHGGAGRLAAPGRPRRSIHSRSDRIPRRDNTRKSPHLAMRAFGGGGWIRTTVGIASRFTVCPLWPLGNTPICT